VRSHILAQEAQMMTWLWGSRAGAARKLGISQATMRKLERRERIWDEIEIRLIRRTRKLTKDEWLVIEEGYDHIEAFSPKQRRVLRRQGYGGAALIKDTKRFLRNRAKWRRSKAGEAGAIIEEAYA
jgi:hypothetical protein